MATAMRRRQGTRATGSETVEELDKLVTQLIKENQQLRRQVAKLEASGATIKRGRRGANPAERALTSIKRRLERAVAVGPSVNGRRRKPTTAAATPRTTRKPLSPEAAERRRQGLVKAREARRAKREAASAGPSAE